MESFLEEQLAPFKELSLERLRQGPVLTPGLQEVAYSDRVFATPSGKIEIYSEEARARWDADPLPGYSAPVESAEGSPERFEKYPLYFMTPNTKNGIHSQFNHLKMIKAVSEKPRIWIHPEDAQARGIGHNDRVAVFNDRGRLTLKAGIDFTIKQGCVWVTNGWWIATGGAVNFLSRGRETDLAHGAAFHDNLVEIEKAP